jgi:uncharacterized protein (TIGR03435 family)
MRPALAFCSALSFATVLTAQPAAAPRAFEVASIRPNPGPWQVLRGYNPSGPLLNLEAFSIFDLITEAYTLENYQLIIPPNMSEALPVGPYNISAKAPGSDQPTRAEFREMLQDLLASRFHFKFHRETRELPVYALTQSKNGIKFRESKPDAPRVGNHRVHGRNQTIEATQETMEELARELGLFVDRPVIDKTGLKGKYDIDVEATPFFRLTNNPQPEDITMFTAVQETLGLRLDAEKANMPVLVVDAVEKPTEN